MGSQNIALLWQIIKGHRIEIQPRFKSNIPMKNRDENK